MDQKLCVRGVGIDMDRNLESKILRSYLYNRDTHSVCIIINHNIFLDTTK